MHLPVLQPALQLHLIIPINFMGACDREVWILNISAPFKLFWHKSACTAFPILRLTMYSLTAYLFTKSHIAECVKSFIWLSIKERNKITIPMSTLILLLLLLTASIAPPAPFILFFNSFPDPSSTVAPAVNSLHGPI